MTKSKYIEAAERIASGASSFCCNAIGEVGLDGALFREYFEPTYPEKEEAGWFAFWFGEWIDAPENQLARSLALLFMAEMTSEPATKPTKRKGRKK